MSATSSSRGDRFDSLVDLVRSKAKARESIYLGLSGVQRKFANVRESVVLVGPPGSGKTTGVFVPAVLSHSGPVIATSIRQDGLDRGLRSATIAGRSAVAAAMGGSVAELAIDDRANHEAPSVWWDFTEGCEDWNAALRRAKSLARAGIRPTLENFQNWRTWVAELLAPLLFNAALCGDGTDRSIYSIISNGPGEHDPADPGNVLGQLVQLEDLEAHGFISRGHPSIAMLRQFCRAGVMHEETRNGVFLLARTDVLGVFQYDFGDDVERFDIGEFLRSHGTLYITAGNGQAEDVGAVVAALIEAVEQTWVAIPPTERPPSLLLALDEVSVIAPLPSMPAAVGTYGGNGIQLLLGFQHSTQADGAWGQAGRAVLNGGNHLMLFPGLDDTDLLERMSKMSPFQEVHDFEISVVPAFEERSGFADARRLIEERRLVEAKLVDTPASLRRVTLNALAQEIRVRRLGVAKCRLGNTAADILQEVMSLTRCVPRSVRRNSVEIPDIVAAPPRTVFVKSGSTMERHRMVPYYADVYWSQWAP